MLQVAVSHNAALLPPAPGCAGRMGAVGSRRKYIFTAQLDARIRDIYLDHPGAKTRPGIRQLAEQVGIPHWALKKRAREHATEVPLTRINFPVSLRFCWERPGNGAGVGQKIWELIEKVVSQEWSVPEFQREYVESYAGRRPRGNPLARFLR